MSVRPPTCRCACRLRTYLSVTAWRCPVLLASRRSVVARFCTRCAGEGAMAGDARVSFRDAAGRESKAGLALVSAEVPAGGPWRGGGPGAGAGRPFGRGLVGAATGGAGVHG